MLRQIEQGKLKERTYLKERSFALRYSYYFILCENLLRV